MELSRYQFEILTFLEKNGMRTYSIRTLSDTLKLSGSIVNSGLRSLSSAGLVNQKGDVLGITDAGLAAGFGALSDCIVHYFSFA